jgi:hypothetical protein
MERLFGKFTLLRLLDGAAELAPWHWLAASKQAWSQPAHGLLRGLVPAPGCEFLLEGMEGPQAVMLLRKPRVQIVRVSLFKSWKKLPIDAIGQGFAPR